MRFSTWYSAAVVLCGMMAFRPAKALLPCVRMLLSGAYLDWQRLTYQTGVTLEACKQPEFVVEASRFNIPVNATKCWAT